MDELKNKETVFVDNDQLYNKEIKATPKPETNVGVDTNGAFYENIYRAAINDVLDVSSLNSFNQASQSRDQIYSLIDTMAEDSTIAAALELYTEGATEPNDRGQVVWCEANESEVAKEVQFLLDSMNVDKLAYSHMHSLIKYGDLYIRLYRNSDYKQDNLFKKEEENRNERTILNESKESLEEDIRIKAYSKNDHYSYYIEKQANPAELFELTKLGKSYAYIKTDMNPTYNIPVGTAMQSGAFTANMYKFHQQDIYIYEATNFVHACLDDTSSRTPEEVSIFMDKEHEEDPDVTITYKVRRGKPLLQDIFKIWRTLKLIENAVLLNRVTKSSIVRVVGVEVGDMPKEMVGPHLQGIKSMMEQKAAIDTGKGISEYTNPGPVENNIYVPTRDGKGAISTTQIGGDADVSKMADLDYFRDIFAGCLYKDTNIRLASGQIVNIVDIYNHIDEYKGQEIISCQSDGSLSRGTITGIHKTELKDKFLKFVLEDGSTICVTPEHVMMLKDGTFKQAKELTEEDELMSF